MRKLRKAIWVVIGLLVLAFAVVVHQASWEARRQLPGYLSARLSQALKRPVVVGGVGFRLPATFTLREFRVEPLPEEPKAPLVASRVRAGISWWDLIIHRQLKVTGLTLERPSIFAKLDLRQDKKKETSPTESLLALRDQGLRNIRIVDAQAEVLTLLPGDEEETVRAHGLDFSTELRRDRFSYRAGADQWSGAGLEAANIRLAGSGDEAGTITVVDSSARFRGGDLQAKGTFLSQDGDVTMQVQVKDLPIGNLAPQLGIPENWNVAGNLTGTVDVSATSGELRRLQGTVNVARGFVSRSQAVFPWTNASAQVDWKPESIRLDQIDILGNGIQLKGEAAVGGPARLAIPERPFSAKGIVTATSSQSVASLAQLLTFSTPVPGQWDVQQASVDFQARGIVGELDEARATGKIQANGFMIRPRPGGAPLVIQTIQGDLVRGPDVLRLANLRATADGLSAGGQLEIIPTTEQKPGRFAGSGKVDLVNLGVLRQQLPDLPLWEWLRPARAQSHGTLTFTTAGPTQAPETATGSGTFRFNEFDVAVATGEGQTVWTFPIREFTGRLSLAGNRAAARDMKLRSDLFTGGGEVAIAPVSENGRLSGAVRIASERWRQLPPLQGRVPPGLTGGLLVLETRLNGSPANGRIPMAGTLSLQDARYAGTFNGQKRTTRLEAARVAFRTEGERIRVPSYRLVTPQFQTSGAGVLTPAGGAWAVDADGVISTGDAGAVLRWWSGKTSLRGGQLTARYDLNTRTDRTDQAAVDARIRLVNAQPVLPQGSLPFAAEDSRIVAATGRISMRGNRVRFQDLVWKAPRFTANASGTLVANRLAADFGLSTPHWQGIAGELARSLPVAGGILTVAGHIEGPADRLKTAPVRGTVALRGARLASDRNASVPIEGGILDLKAGVNGTLANLVGSRIAGDFSLRQLTLPALGRGRTRMAIESARGRFEREGTRVSLSDFVAQASGARLTGSGELRGVGTGQASHSLRLAASGPALAGVLPALVVLPGKASGGRFSGTLTVSGTARTPVTQMEGRAEVQSAEWTPPGQTQSLKIQRMAAHLVRRGSTATLDNVEVKVEGGGEARLAGTLQDLDTPGKTRHTLRVNWRLEDASAWASRFFPIPGWFTGGVFTGNATVAGTASAPAQTASGDFKVVDAGFSPPAKVLRGPIRPISVNVAQGRFHRTGKRTVLDQLNLNTSIGTASGQVVAADGGSADVQARVNITRFEPLIDLWPGFKDRVVGGSGEMVVALRGPLRQPRRLAGTVDVRVTGGALTLEDLDPLYAHQPFDELSTRMVLSSNGAVQLQKVRLRGPKANLDGEAKIAPDGVLYGDGKAWFSKQYTKQLVKPKFLYPIAKLIGHGKLHSRFEVHGTLRRAMLDMGIKDSLLWKAGLKKKVPEPLRAIATGKAPIWDGNYAAPRVATR